MYARTIPTLQEVVSACDEERLVGEVIRFREGDARSARDSLRNAVERDLRSALEELCSYENKNDSSMVAVSRVKFSPQSEGLIKRRVLATYLDMQGLSGPRTSMPLLPFNEALRCGVWFGGDACLADRYEMLASMCWDLAVNEAMPATEKFKEESSGSASDCQREQEWASRASRQWDLSIRDSIDEERLSCAQKSCELLNMSADTQFLIEVSNLERYLGRPIS